MWSTLKEVIMQKVKAGAAAAQKGPSATPADHGEVPPDSHGTRASDSVYKRACDELSQAELKDLFEHGKANEFSSFQGALRELAKKQRCS
eukprot:2035415-Pyramimonas_sp.AAC.1